MVRGKGGGKKEKKEKKEKQEKKEKKEKSAKGARSLPCVDHVANSSLETVLNGMCGGAEPKHEKRSSGAEPLGAPAIDAGAGGERAREEQRLLEEQRDEAVHSSQAKIRVVGING